MTLEGGSGGGSWAFQLVPAYQAGSTGSDQAHSFAPTLSDSADHFTAAGQFAWFQPTVNDANGVKFSMVSAGETFSQIVAFPTGVAQSFLVTADGTPLGSFAPGSSLDFNALLSHGASEFEVTPVGATSSVIPLQLNFSDPGVSFDSAALPEPSCMAIFIGGLLALSRRARGRFRFRGTEA